MSKDKKNPPRGEKLAVTSDERFKSVHNDPRFRLPNLKQFKVKVDERFSKNVLKKLNTSATGKKVKIDRYGRKLTKSDDALDKYYEHEEEEEEEEGDEDDNDEDDESDEEEVIEDEENDEEIKVGVAPASESEEETGSSEDDEQTLVGDIGEKDSLLDRARGEGLASSSEDEEDSEPGSDSDGSVDFEEEEEESEIELEEGKPEEGEPTSSFAVVNMDWDNVKAIDLMATFSSFVPTSGLIKSVSIYPSEFGKEQMQKEEIEGPPRDLFKSKKAKKQDDSDSDSEDDLDVKNPADLAKVTKKLYEEDNGEEDYDSKALRRYQLQRLRYYYAVVKCDSVETSKKIYDNCDGSEFESTANIFDLRYVPEDMEFEDEPQDVCTKITSKYKPNSTFVTDALQHSKVKLTWDETPKERLHFASRQFSQKEIDDMDFKAYLASDSEGEEENEVSAKDKYKNLLGDRFQSFGSQAQIEDDDEGDVDMEITFNPALAEAEKKAEIQGAVETKESSIDAYKRKEKERRVRRMEKFREQKRIEKEARDSTKDDKTKSKRSKGKSKGNNEPVDDKAKAELELIMMDENAEEQEPKHFNMKDIIKSEKQSSKKGKKRKNYDNEMVQDNFEVDLNDPRFKEVFENHDYAIDPTNTEFKKTDTMKKILDERSKRKKFDSKPSNKKQKNNNDSKNNQGNNDYKSIVDKFKHKGKK